MMTRPPCYNPETKGDCPRRYVGCRASCEAWHEWLVIHAEEKEQRYTIYRRDKDINTFEAQQGDRIHKLNRVRNAQEKARRR